MANIQWGYAINQWRNLETELARKDQMESAFKVISVAGFKGIEVTDSALGGNNVHGGRTITGFFGSTRNFMEQLRRFGIQSVPSYFTGLDWANASNAGDHPRLKESARQNAEFLAEVGGTRLVVRPMGPYWREAPITDDKIKLIADCWNSTGAVTKNAGVALSVHLDFLCGLRSEAEIEKFLKLTDPAVVGLTLDTAELTIAGIDPVKFYNQHHARVNHIHFKDAKHVDDFGGYKQPNAEIDYWPANLVLAGADHGVDRWYYEMGTPGGLVDFPALLTSLYQHDYNGWIIAESDQSPHVEESVLLNAWYRKFVLSKIEKEAQQLAQVQSA